MKLLVLITGAGRSGTSTMAGMLHHLGLFVPGPYLSANESNPKGFFESRWSVRFHNPITKDAEIHIFDARPDAFDRVQQTLTPERRTRLADFLRVQSEHSDQVVVKDPRSVWTQSLWRDAAGDAGLQMRCVTMLRHPAEVVGSRTTYYGGAGDDEAQRRQYSTLNVARWINSSLISERETRGQRRAFVRYPDLLDDWRGVMAGVADDLELRYDADLSAAGHHPVDDFIDPSLRRHAVTWEEVATPPALRDLAEAVWQQLQVLTDSHDTVPAASNRLDALAGEYECMLADAQAISRDAIIGLEAAARREGAARERQRLAEREARHQSRSLEARPVGELGGRDLLRVARRRISRRLRPSR